MPVLKRFFRVVGSSVLEFDPKPTFLVEFWRHDNFADVQVISIIPKVYILKCGPGMTARIDGEDTSFRKNWQLLEDFPEFEASTPEGVFALIKPELEKFAEAYAAKFPGPKLS